MNTETTTTASPKPLTHRQTTDALLSELARVVENSATRTHREQQHLLGALEDRLREHAAESYSANQIIRDTVAGREPTDPTERALHALARWHHARAAMLELPRRDFELEHRLALTRRHALICTTEVALDRFGTGIIWEPKP